MHTVTVVLLLGAACAATAAPCCESGKVNFDAARVPGVGTSVHVHGQTDLHRFQDGSTLHGNANYGQVLSGPARGVKDFGAGLGVDGRHGDFGVNVQRQPGFGDTLGVQVGKDLYRSNDGSVRIHAEAHHDRVLNGPARGRQDTGGSIQFTGQFPRH